MEKEKINMTMKILLLLAILLFSVNSAWAFPVTVDIDFLTSSGGQGPRDVPLKNPQNTVTLSGITTVTNSPMSSSTSGSGWTQDSYANPLGFQVNNRISAESGIHAASVDGVGTWFVLTGPGTTANLIADIAFQGLISASSGGKAWFTNYLSFTANSASLISEYPIVQNGSVGSVVGTTTLAGTVPDFTYLVSGDYQINEIIRSKPFTVTIGTPFRLGLVLNSTLDGSATVDFDPGFSTLYFGNGFALADGNTLASGGYSVAPAVPIPPTVLLLGSGLLGLAGWRRFRKS